MQTNTPPRRPGELLFNLFVIAVSLFLFYTAYGIAGFDALSSAGAIPMVTTAIMVLCGILILRENLKKSPNTAEKVARDILPLPVIVTIAAITAYAFLLKPLGFIPTSFLFLLGLMRLFSGRSFLFSAAAAAASVALIYIIFRLIFTVLMPQGVVPESEVLAFVSSLFGGAK
jgi:putative tricarboxylic transport membrane protein